MPNDSNFTDLERVRLRKLLDRDEKWEWLLMGVRRVAIWVVPVFVAIGYFADTIKTWLKGWFV